MRNTDKKIIDYKVLRNDTLEVMAASVREAIKDGWQPLGGVSHTAQLYAQAMVLYEGWDNE